MMHQCPSGPRRQTQVKRILLVGVLLAQAAWVRTPPDARRNIVPELL